MSIRVLSAVAALCLYSIAHAGVPTYTVRDFVSDPKASVPYLSPDGKRLAMLVPDGATTRLVVFDLETKKFTLSMGFGGDIHVGSFDWVSDKRLVFNTVIKVGSFDQKLLTGNLYAIDYDGKGKATLWGPEAGDGTFAEVINTLRDDDENVIVLSWGGGTLGNQPIPTAWKIDVNQDLGKGDSGSRVRKPKRDKLVTSAADNGSIGTDAKGTAFVAIGTNEKTGYLQAFYRAPGESDWSDHSELVKHDENARFVAFMADGRILLITDKEDGYDGLFAYDPKTRQRTLLAGRSDVDIARVVSAFDGSGRVVGLDFLPGYPERQYLSGQDQDAQIFAKVEANFPDDIVEITSMDKARTKALVFTWNDRNAGDAYLFDVASGQLTRLFNVRPNLDRRHLAESFPVAYPTRDGLTVRGYLTLPQGRKNNLPLIILPHGGPHGIWDRWGWDYDSSYYPEVQLLAHHGYAVFQPNFRGSGGYGSRWEVIGYKNWGTTMQDDLTDAVKWAVGKGYADPKRVCIYGASYGGYAALMSPAREPDLYKCAIGYVGVYDVAVLFERSDTKRTAYGRRVLEVYHGTDTKFWAGESPITFIDKIKADLMLVAGEKDERVHIEHYKRMSTALTRAGRTYESLVKPNEGHGFAEVENRVELYTKMLAFLQRNIGGPDTAVALPDNPPKK